MSIEDYTPEPTHVRVWTDGAEWFIDGCDDEGNYTEQCWSYDTHEAAIADVWNFVANTIVFGRADWKWRRRTTPRN